MSLIGTFTSNPIFGNVTATGTVDLGNTGSEMSIFRRFNGDALVNDLASPIDSPVYELNFNATDSLSFYKYTYGTSISFKNANKALEIHGFNPDGNGGLGNWQPLVHFSVTDGTCLTQIRNAYDTSSLEIRGVTNSANFTINTENGNGNIIVSPHGNGCVGIKTASPTARLHLPAGAAGSSLAPLKLTAGTNLSTPESGAVEWDGTNLYITQSDGTRKTLAYV